MRKALFAEYPPFTQLIMAAFTMVSCGLFFTFIGILFAPLVLDISMSDLMNMISTGKISQNLYLMRYLQSLQGITLFIIPALFIGYLFSGNVAGYFGLCQTVTIKWFLASVLLTVAAIPCINLLGALNEMIILPDRLSGLEQKFRELEDAAQEITKLFLNVDNIGGMFFNIFMMALLPALGEELIFRGVLQKIFIRWAGNIHVAIIITGFVFSLFHMQFYGFFPRWLLGIIYGYLLVWSGTIWIPIIAHFANNALIVTVSYLIRKGHISEEIEFFGASWSDIPITIVALALCIWLLWKMHKKCM